MCAAAVVDATNNVVESTTPGGVIIAWNYGRHGGGSGWSIPGGCNLGDHFGADWARLLVYLEAQPAWTRVACRKAQDAYFLERVYHSAEERLSEARHLVDRASHLVRELQQDLAAAHIIAPAQAQVVTERMQRLAAAMA